MQRLCDEVLQLIFYELIDPTPLTLVSKRFHRFSQDPYVRAHYFLARYGPIEAVFHAFGRAKLIDHQVLDILLSSGAQISRYLIQVSMHHYFYTQSHFIKTPWVRNLPLRVFTHFLQRAEERYGEIPRGKSEDDGYVFSTFLKESRLPPQSKSVSWDTVRELLEKYKFIPFSNKDPIMAQFPIALAIEPRLLSYAVNNGFCMDTKYRDFVFRKMFEKPISADDTLAADITHNVRELCRLDPTMFVSRTVAAEVCMEAKTNDAGYAALKQLDKSGVLRFELSHLVEDLIKSFIASRLISHGPTIEILRYLFTDFPSSDPTARLVMLIAIFILPDNLHHSPTSLHAQLQVLGLTPVTKKDVFNILLNPFVERYQPLLDYVKREIGVQEDGTKGVGQKELIRMVEEISGKCLEISCKGKLLRKFCDGFPGLLDNLTDMVIEKYQIKIGDLPSWEDGGNSCKRYEAKLCRDLPCGLPAHETGEVDVDKSGGAGNGDVDEPMERNGNFNTMKASNDESASDLGSISQESLSTMIRRDEVTPVRSRRRMYFPHSSLHGDANKLLYPLDPLHVGRWVKSYFGPMSSITAIFMTHAIINDNSSMLHHYIYSDSSQLSSTAAHVPITLKHFQILARLGRAPSFFMFHDIEAGAEFYFDENDYISKYEAVKKSRAVKTEVISPSFSTSRSRTKSDASTSMNSRGRKRPRRAATAVRSYAVPDSDDDMHSDAMETNTQEQEKKPRAEESSLQKWLKHLGYLLKEEQRKYQKHKKLIEITSEPDMKVRVAKTEFLRSLSSRMRNLRKAEEQQRVTLYGPSMPTDEFSDDDDDAEYHAHSKRRATRAS